MANARRRIMTLTRELGEHQERPVSCIWGQEGWGFPLEVDMTIDQVRHFAAR